MYEDLFRKALNIGDPWVLESVDFATSKVIHVCRGKDALTLSSFISYHIMKIVNEGIDMVRREEQAINEALKKTRITNGILEGTNSVIQLLKRSARGYRNIPNFITMIYLRLGHLKFQLPT